MIEAHPFRHAHIVAHTQGRHKVVSQSLILGGIEKVKNPDVIVFGDVVHDAIQREPVAKEDMPEHKPVELQVSPQSQQLHVGIPPIIERCAAALEGELDLSLDWPLVTAYVDGIHQLERMMIVGMEKLRADIDQVGTPRERYHAAAGPVGRLENLNLESSLPEPIPGCETSDACADYDDFSVFHGLSHPGWDCSHGYLPISSKRSSIL